MDIITELPTHWEEAEKPSLYFMLFQFHITRTYLSLK